MRATRMRQQENAREDDFYGGRNVSYDLSIHNNPDAMAWAKFFCESHPNCGLDEGAMVGWFASAMMAMHDHILKIGPLNGGHAQFLMDQERAT